MNIMTFFIVIAFLATFAVLLAGGLSMVRGGKFDWAHSAEFMEGRVLMQAIAIGLIVIAALFWS